ncbi:MAG: Gfo/Idh/MocA family protein, partial [Blastocatellia bacterium]
MRGVRAGLIGAGFVGPLHIEAVRRLGYVEVIGVAASNLESAKKRAASLGVHRAYGSFQDMLDDPDIEAVHICTPNYLHHSIALAAIARGKHVICDKPLGLTAAEARE